MKKRYILIFMLLLTGCSFDAGRVRLFNYNLWGSSPSMVKVSRGDTLYSISRSYNVPLRDLIESNGLRPPYSLNVGQVLRLPNAKYHIVSKGDTLYNISKRYNVDVTSLSRSNNIQAPYGLAIGQRLVLPGSVVDGGSNYASSSRSYSSSSPISSTSQRSDSSSAGSYVPPPAYRKSKFVWPVRGKTISSFGAIGKGRTNDGINIQAPQGSNVKAADSGTVAYAGNELKGFGNLILIRHDDGWVTAYAHNEKILVKKGQKIAKGEKISTVGTTGGVSVPQLHFEIRRGKKPVNPQSYLQ